MELELNEDGRYNICEEKKFILKDLIGKVEILNKQIEMIENLKIEPVTEENWHELCKTLFRGKNISLKIAEATFPHGENFKLDLNKISFEMQGFNIYVPTSELKGIEIGMSWYKQYLLQDFKPKNRYKRMRKYFKLLDEGNSKWYELAESTCPTKLNKAQLLKYWFLKGKWHKNDRNLWEEKFKLEDKQNNDEYLKYKKNQEDLKEKIKKFYEVVDILKEWSEVKGHILQNGIYSTVNIENFLR
ncbi:TPA: hypothetical protein KOR49_002413 [Clostridioides difficile]|uniref:Uncharacterized protein n=1 Tax=Clostridioides difficile TaxID=1496 RepID=A0AAN6A660_CLODI|nr:hypothetical protein [Clostridioides difficile]EGT3944000.1 hypothetical protein [Clostridioides difficile]MBG0197949.1 hypothetical protein [Clostridioides difficile]MCA0574606.1 hypothetical protein [Clostridioides difficile]SJT19620.1 Uncharacterised protein [Clostridioides difficile]VHT35226.1 Uncharacterised protein [Clostridioides difficile]